MKEQLLENLRLRKELVLCETDIIYFMSTYVNVAHSTHGSMLFQPHPYQEKYLTDIAEGNSIVSAARRAGSSLTTTLFVFWEGFFNKCKTQVFVSHRIDQAAENLQSIRHAYATLPAWLRDSNPMVVNSKTRLEFANGSRFHAVTAMARAFSGMTINTLFVDNFSLIRSADELFSDDTLTTLITHGSKIIIVSQGDSSTMFHSMFSDAEKGYGSFKPVRLVPDY